MEALALRILEEAASVEADHDATELEQLLDALVAEKGSVTSSSGTDS